MTIAKYCKDKGMNIEQYETFCDNIKNTASAIIQLIKQNYNIDTGMYHKTIEILPFIPGKTEEQIQLFIMHELRNNGIEFIENGEYWRL